jgi:hypothetical protein
MSSLLVGSEKRYVDTYVDPAYLAQLKKAMDDEHSPKKYGKFKAWLHYANLQRWQNQGWHYAYLNYNGKELHCTCGLAVELNSKSDINEDFQKKFQFNRSIYDDKGSQCSRLDSNAKISILDKSPL